MVERGEAIGKTGGGEGAGEAGRLGVVWSGGHRQKGVWADAVRFWVTGKLPGSFREAAVPMEGERGGGRVRAGVRARGENGECTCLCARGR